VRLVWAIPCARIFRDPRTGLVEASGLGFSAASVPELPEQIEFWVAMRFAWRPDEAEATYRGVIELTRPSGKIEELHRGPIRNTDPSPLAAFDEELTSDVYLPFDFRADDPGMYRITLHADGEPYAEIPIRISLEA
jgi:hypothetical protein